jgi:hypothetical protein
MTTVATASNPSANEDAILGFWETVTFQNDGLKVEGWAVRKKDGTAPDSFTFRWGNSRFDSPPNITRVDVPPTVGFGTELCGVRGSIPFPSDVMSDWTNVSLHANWSDGATRELPKSRSLSLAALGRFNFNTFEDFQSQYQNPAFRIKSPLLQAYGAARALRMAGDNLAYWLAAATVAIYRCIEDDIFPVAEAEALIKTWREHAPHLDASATGLMMRWATSMHLAAGYAHLAWGQYEEARKEFTVISRYADRITTWPQAVTNIGIGMFIGAWLEWRQGNIEAAKAVLAPTLTMFQEGVGVLKIWNWHMYEELRGATNISQMCFTFLKRLETDPEEHIVPSSVVLKLANTSAVLNRLINRGLVKEEILPMGNK